jgi:hypothetical protein
MISPQQATGCGRGVAVIACVEAHVSGFNPKDVIMTTELDDMLRASFAEVILRVYYGTEQPDPKLVPANKVWLAEKGLVVLPRRKIKDDSRGKEISKRKGLDMWMSSRDKDSDDEDAIEAAKFLDQRVIREAEQGPQNIKLPLSPYHLLVGGYHIEDVLLNRRRATIIANSLPDKNGRSVWTSRKTLDAAIKLAQDVVESLLQTEDEGVKEAVAGHDWLQKMQRARDAGWSDNEIDKFFGIKKERPFTDQDYLEQGLKVPQDPDPAETEGRVLGEVDH